MVGATSSEIAVVYTTRTRCAAGYRAGEALSDAACDPSVRPSLRRIRYVAAPLHGIPASAYRFAARHCFSLLIDAIWAGYLRDPF